MKKFFPLALLAVISISMIVPSVSDAKTPPPKPKAECRCWGVESKPIKDCGNGAMGGNYNQTVTILQSDVGYYLKGPEALQYYGWGGWGWDKSITGWACHKNP